MKLNSETQNIINVVCQVRKHTFEEIISGEPYFDYKHSLELLCYLLYEHQAMKQTAIAMTCDLYGASEVCKRVRKIEYLIEHCNKHVIRQVNEMNALIKKQFVDAN